MNELDRAHELLTDAGIPRADDYGQPISLAARVGLLIDESNSVHAELDGLLKSLAP
jgi:hypothetical protein